jgi:membrane protease YdiL (CAAX protease family)
VSACGPDEFCTVAGVTDAMMLDAVPPPAATADAPREYPQALRGPRHRWWRPLLGLGVVVAGLAVVTGALLLCVLGFVVAESMGAELPDPASDAFLVSPAGMLVTNLGLALGIPLALAATWAQAGRAGLVSSVLGRVRWRLLLGGLGLALLLLVPLTVGADLLLTQLGFPAGGEDAGAGSSTDETGPWPLTPASGWIALSVVILLTTPLQSAGEEYFFRGWLSQWIGSWLRWRWVAVVVPALVTGLLFALAHGAQSPWLFADRLVFGLLASLLVWRTGGLEIAVAMHAANNLLAFGLAIAYDRLEESLLITEIPPLDGAVSIAITILTGAVLLWWARRRSPDLVVTDPVPSELVRPEPMRPEPMRAGPADGETA